MRGTRAPDFHLKGPFSCSTTDTIAHSLSLAARALMPTSTTFGPMYALNSTASEYPELARRWRSLRWRIVRSATDRVARPLDQHAFGHCGHSKPPHRSVAGSRVRLDSSQQAMKPRLGWSKMPARTQTHRSRPEGRSHRRAAAIVPSQDRGAAVERIVDEQCHIVAFVPERGPEVK